MLKENRKSTLLWIIGAEAVGILSGLISREGMEYFSQAVNKPPFSPPGWLFPLAWTVLYALMGFGAARVSRREQTRDRSRGLNLYVGQLIVNFFWSPIFFNARAYGLAFAWLGLLLVLVAAMTGAFRRVDRTAAAAQIPYILWLIFAGYLNAGVWFANR